MRLFEASLEMVIIRFYLMMAAVIIPFFIGVPALAILSLPIFISAFMGVSLKKKKVESKLVLSSRSKNTTQKEELKAVA